MKSQMPRPEEYTVSVRLENFDGEWVHVARVAEIPDIVEFSDDPAFARSLALDSIATSREMCADMGIEFPLPSEVVDEQYSGRVTLRISKELHRACALNALKQGVTLNHYMSCKIAGNEARSDVISQIEILTTALHEATVGMGLFHASKIYEIQNESHSYTKYVSSNLTSAFRNNDTDESDDITSDSFLPGFFAQPLFCR